MLPEWMVSPKKLSPPVSGKGFPETTAPPVSAKIRTRWNPVRAPASAFYQVAKRELLMGESASRPGFLQRIDPRVKLVAAVLLIVGTSLLGSVPILAVVLVSAFTIAGASRLSLGALLRLLLPPAIVTSLLILPAVLNVITPGSTLAYIGHIGEGRSYFGMEIPAQLTITHEGVMTALRFTLRSVTCVTWAVILVLSAGPRSLLAALGSMGLPRIFALTLQMMYRYLFVLTRYAEDTQTARRSRTISSVRTLEKDRRAAGEMGRLFQTARRLADQVYLAMVARGFSGASK